MVKLVDLEKLGIAIDKIKELFAAVNAAIDGKADTEHSHTKAEITDFPESLKNPNALTVKVGDVTSTYDGSDAVTVSVEAVMEEEINDAIKELYVNNYDGSEGQLNMLIELSGGLSETVNVGDDANVYICNNGDAYLAGSGETNNYTNSSRPFEGNETINVLYVLNGITGIGNQAFGNCESLISVVIADSVVSIGISAFYSCAGLTSITMPNSVIEIGIGAFERCTSLKSMLIPNSVTSIQPGTFQNCVSLVSITIPSSVTSIGANVFRNCTALTTITINKPQDSITGQPWGAAGAEVIWTGGE